MNGNIAVQNLELSAIKPELTISILSLIRILCVKEY